MKKIALLALCLLMAPVTEMRALPSHSGAIAAAATATGFAALGHYLKPEENVWGFVALGAAVSLLVGYFVNKWTPESKFEWSQNVGLRAYAYAHIFDQVKSAEDVPALAIELYTCTAWPVAVTFETLQGHAYDVSCAVTYLEEAILDRAWDAEFVESARELKRALSEIACSLREIMLLVRKSPDFEQELHNHKMLKLEQQKVAAQRQIAFNTAINHCPCHF